MLDLIIAGFEIFIGIGIIVFWIYFFVFEYKDPEQKEWYIVYERTFPLPDIGWITPCLFMGAYGLITGENYGIFFTIAAGSGMMFLGLIDIAFSIQNGIFKTKDFKAYLNIIVLSLSLIFAIVFTVYGWIKFNAL
ncbi:MAG: hypothetical protein ACFFHV_03330 [Promethearchaeota archaeon]